MDRWVDKVAIVTGASSGIGEAIASRLVEEGVRVVAVARRKDRLESLANKLSGKKGQLHPFVADITKSDELIKAFEWTNQNVGLLHILVNNAGTGRRGKLPEFKIEDAKAMFDLNVIALSIATREALKVFKENNIQGHIININSIAGHWVSDFPGNALYTASKHAVTALTESTYLEIKNMKLGAKATSISPGMVATEIFTPDFAKEMEARHQCKMLQPKDVADAVLFALSTPPNCQVDELIIRPIATKESAVEIIQKS